MLTINNECFLFRKLSVDFRHFRVFVFCHRAYSSTFLSILCVQDKTFEVLLRVIKEHLLLKLEIDFFLLLKQKWYVDNKLIVFSSFLVTVKCLHWVLLYLESFLLISGISGFSFFAIEHIRKPGNHGKFSEAHFLRYYGYLSDFEHFSRHFVFSRQNSEGVAQSYQGALTIKAWN